jgi:hypothetical protein
VTESEWLTCIDPQEIQRFLQGKVGERTWRLLACACCRRVWHLLADERSRLGVEAAERFADGRISREELRAAGWAAYRAWEETDPRDDDHEDDRRYDPHHGQACFHAANAIVRLTGTGEGWAHGFDDDDAPSEICRAVWFAPASGTDQRTAEAEERTAQCDLARELVGNPFHPVTIDPAWLTATVLSLARTMYESRDFSPMPILADALQDAGCDNEAILNHCRDRNQVHVRGCWVIDLVLEKG